MMLSYFHKPQNLTSLYYCVKKRLQHMCYLVKFAKYLRTLFFTAQYFTKPTFVCSENLGKILSTKFNFIILLC